MGNLYMSMLTILGVFLSLVIDFLDFLSGKPDPMKFVIMRIQKILDRKVLLVSIGKDKKKDGNTYFVIDPKPTISKKLLASLGSDLHVSPDKCTLVDWEYKRKAICLSKEGVEEVKTYIDTFPNIIEKIFRVRISNFQNKFNLLFLAIFGLAAILGRSRITNHDIQVIYSLLLVVSSGVGKYGTMMTQKHGTTWANSEYVGFRQLIYMTMFWFGLAGLIF